MRRNRKGGEKGHGAMDAAMGLVSPIYDAGNGTGYVVFADHAGYRVLRVSHRNGEVESVGGLITPPLPDREQAETTARTQARATGATDSATI